MKKKGVPTSLSPIYNAVTHIIKTQHCRWGKGVLIYKFRRILNFLIIYAQDCLKNYHTWSFSQKKRQPIFPDFAYLIASYVF